MVEPLIALPLIGHSLFDIQLRDRITTLANKPWPMDTFTVGRIAQELGETARKVVATGEGLYSLAAQTFPPTVWMGRAADQAELVMHAVRTDVDIGAEAFDSASGIMARLSDAYTAAQSRYEDAKHVLKSASTPLSMGMFTVAADRAVEAADRMESAVAMAVQADHEAARDLTELALRARARAMKESNLEPSDMIVLATASNPYSPARLNTILRFSDARRAASSMKAMSIDDREKFIRLLKDSKSPEERAYIVKTLGAGYDLREVENFSRLIHNHGDDPRWLSTHLSPIINDPKIPRYNASDWIQDGPNCAPTAIVMARTMVDPKYALWLTTGNQPDDLRSASGSEFTKRLKSEQKRLQSEGQQYYPWFDRHFKNMEGIGVDNKGYEAITDENLGKHNGQDYALQESTDTDIRIHLSAITQAVDEGYPVPLIVKASVTNHALLVVGHDDDLLQVYNPAFGTVTWITERDFLNGRLDDVGKYPKFLGAFVPSKSVP